MQSRDLLVLDDGRFRLSSHEPSNLPSPSVDRFLMSLADAWGSRAVAVILSGTGNDGAQGVRAVKLAGGVALVQSRETARHGGMPLAAAQTGTADGVMSPEDIAAAVVRCAAADGVVDITTMRTPARSDTAPSARSRILRLVRERTGVDLEQYRESTIGRRVRRRANALKLADEESYARHCERDPEEPERLLAECLISVSAFFRDASAFARLEAFVDRMLAGKGARDEVRVWVPACATGEEAYSLVMLFLERFGALDKPPSLKIFATDIDSQAMVVARRGVYGAAALSRVGPERLSRFFAPVDGGFEVRPEVRLPVVFARHDIARDPPLLRIDLLSCRNLLIYFKPSLQARVLQTLSYATAPRGLVFLGRSESAVQFGNLFETLDKTARVFRSRGARPVAEGYALAARGGEPDALARRAELRETHEAAVARLHAPPSLIVTRDGHVLSVAGDAATLLRFPADRLLLTLGNVLPSTEGVEAMSVLQRAARQRTRVSGRSHAREGGRSYRLVIDPLSDDGSRFLVAFVTAMEIGPADGSDDGAALRSELAVTRDHLETVVEELETSNEAMQTLNEELQTSNEELQSSNEELQSTNEELETSNEELNTANEELAHRADQLAVAGTEMLAILSSLPFPVLLLDRELRLARHNAPAGRLFGIEAGATGIAAGSFALPEPLRDLPQEIAAVAAAGTMLERRVSIGPSEYLLIITRCDGPEVTGGVLVELVDVTRLTRAQEALRASEARLKAMLDHTPMMVATTDERGGVVYANPRFLAWAATTLESVAGRVLWDLFEGPTGATVKRRFGDVMTSDAPMEGEHPFELGERAGQMYSLLYPLRNSDGPASGYCFMAMDVTELTQTRAALGRADAINRSILGALSSEIAVLDNEGRILAVNDAWHRFAEENGASVEGHWLGTNYLSVCDPALGCPPGVAPGIRAVLEGRSAVFEHEYPCDSPTEARWFRLVVAQLHDAEARAVIMHIDISRAKQAQILAEAKLAGELALGRQRERDLQQAVEELEMFSYTVSHDLRAPLRAIVGFADLLREETGDTLSDDAAGHLGRIIDAGQRMHRYIEGILELSHLARGSLTVREFDLSALAAEVVVDVRRQHPDRQVECLVHPGMRVAADPPLLRAVLENLIGNAWKYLDPNRRGEVEIGVKDEADGKVYFVRDNGRGFDMAYRDKLFVPFQRLHRESGIAGHGIGLAAAKRIVMRHGGRIWAEGRPGYGATFCFTLP